MIDKTVEIPTRDGRMKTFITRPEEKGRYPAVILYMDALGIREELRDMARRLATAGYCVVSLSLVWRGLFW